ncbi:MAG: heavy-metal-associated domain-containing protein [Streptococcaceae bacterium]|jgi:copper chaperone CopZ|nr:heavy-metal-associated domain-containing protein [Streptococcaceae bacterium]
MAENDAVTSATLRAEGTKINENHHHLRIAGMTCEHCVKTVAAAILGVPGVIGVKVFLERAEAQYDESEVVDVAAIQAAVKESGYEVAEVID